MLCNRTERSAGLPNVYDVLADYYDRFTAHHDYELWVGRLLGLARVGGLRGARALDVGCGTGKSIEPLLRRGFDVTGCDLSQGMLDVAAVKLGPAVELHRCDLRSLPRLGSFDLVTCLDDVLNYVTDPGALERALAGLARNLAPGGRLLFDANTLATYRGFFRVTEAVEDDASLLIWRGEAPAGLPPGELARARLDIFERRDDGWVRSTSHHEQRHHPEPLVRRAIERAGLSLLGVYGQDPAVNLEAGVDELRHSKAIYLASCPEPSKEVNTC
jgi:SAM-dependent methyltransferase